MKNKAVRKPIDMTGQKFGRLTVLRLAEKPYKSPLWVCICDCGIQTVVDGRNLRSGNSSSCGCLKKEISIKHGMTKEREHGIWRHILSRCNNQKDKAYKHYGGRGIKVSDEWMEFKNFYADMGKSPFGSSIDRINNDGNYCKENCRWVNHSQQMRNTRRSTKQGVGVVVLPNGRFRAWIHVNRKNIHLGVFDLYADAIKARKEGEKRYWSDL